MIRPPGGLAVRPAWHQTTGELVFVRYFTDLIHEDSDIKKIRHPYVNRNKLIVKNNKFSHIIHKKLVEHSLKSLELAQNAIDLTIKFINTKKQSIPKKYKKKKIEFKCGNLA